MAVLATFLLEISNPAIGPKQYFECDGNVLFPTVVCSLDKRGFFSRQTLTRTVVAHWIPVRGNDGVEAMTL